MTGLLPGRRVAAEKIRYEVGFAEEADLLMWTRNDARLDFKDIFQPLDIVKLSNW